MASPAMSLALRSPLSQHFHGGLIGRGSQTDVLAEGCGTSHACDPRWLPSLSALETLSPQDWHSSAGPATHITFQQSYIEDVTGFRHLLRVSTHISKDIPLLCLCLAKEKKLKATSKGFGKSVSSFAYVYVALVSMMHLYVSVFKRALT